jgi:hypothetical protein
LSRRWSDDSYLPTVLTIGGSSGGGGGSLSVFFFAPSDVALVHLTFSPVGLTFKVYRCHVPL